MAWPPVHRNPRALAARSGGGASVCSVGSTRNGRGRRRRRGGGERAGGARRPGAGAAGGGGKRGKGGGRREGHHDARGPNGRARRGVSGARRSGRGRTTPAAGGDPVIEGTRLRVRRSAGSAPRAQPA